MPKRLFDVHQGADSRWRWHGWYGTNKNQMIVSEGSWGSRPEAGAALTRFLTPTERR